MIVPETNRLTTPARATRPEAIHGLATVHRAYLFPPRDRRRWSQGCAWLAAWLMLATPAFALDPARTADSYSVQGWSTEQGLPSSKIRSVTGTRDGYLWIATAQGMARFDGLHFTVFTRATNPELGGGGFFSVVEAPDGTLWFGGDNGLFSWRTNHFNHITTKDGLADNYVRALFLGRNGAVVVCTRNGFSFIHDGHITTPGGVWKQVSSGARSYLKMADGSILLGNVDKVWRVSGEKIEPYAGATGLPGDGFSSLEETPDGSVWIGYNRGLRRVYPDGKTEDYGEAQGLMDLQVVALRADRDGNLWIGTTGGGLYRLTHGRIEAAAYSEQFGTTPIRQIYEDREGGLWIATATGLFRLKDNISASIGIAQGLKRTSVSAMLETRDGSWWIGLMSSGIYHYDGIRATPLALPAKVRLNEVTCLAEDPAGTLWIGTLSGLYRHAGEATTSLNQRDQETAWQKQIKERPDTLLPGLAHRRVSSVATDGAGGIWVATEGALYHGREGEFRAYTKADGLPGNIFKSVIRSRTGDIWVTVPPEGVACLHEGRWTNYLCGKAISDVFPRIVYEDTTGTIWVTTDGGGINRYKAGRWRTFTSRDGLDDDFVSAITEDNLGNLWIACLNGILRIPLKQFEELDAGGRALLQPRIVNQSDGLPSAEVNQIGSPNACRAHDGRLFFATDRGVAIIQPTDLKINRLTLPMHIERLVVNGADVNLSGPLVIPPGNNDVQIHYTAISLLAAEKVRFKIRLEPLDHDWMDNGDRRDVRYAKLPPGNYTFRVTSCNSDGLWNEAGVALDFTVQRYFYQTAWFIGLVLVTAGGASFGFYRARVRRARRRTAELEGMVAERTSELQWKTAFLEAQNNSSIDGIMVVNEHGKKAFQNQRTADLFKIPRAIADGDDDAAQVRCVTDLAKNPKQFVEKVGYLYSHPDEISRDEIELIDGTILDRYSAPVIGQDGKYYGRIWTFRDITERKRAEKLARENEERYRHEQARLRALVDSIPDLIFFKDKESVFLGCNKAFEVYSGIAEGELIGKSDAELLPRELAESYRQKDREMLASGKGLRIEEWIPSRSGGGGMFETLKTAYYDSQGELLGLIGVSRDITERKRLEAQLVQSQKLETVGKLAGGIAHEFNSILTAIIGQSELLLTDLPAESPLAKNATEISHAAGRAATLTRQLLAFGRKQFLQPENLDLNRVIANMEGMFHHLMGVDVDTQFIPAAGLPTVKADAGQIEQVIMNLVMNARDAMPNGGQLTLETANVSFDQETVDRYPELKPGCYVMLAITDTGTGMSEEVKARVFEPFFSTKAVGQGTGLGLSTCYGIIKQSGGHINVYSEPARGTTFKIYLPQVDLPPPIPIQRLDSPQLPHGTETILLVEDDPALREMAAALLRRLGYTVLSAANGIEALNLKRPGDNGHIDLLFTDIVMPHMSGKELADRMQAFHPHIRILFTSAYTENAIVHQGVLNQGAAMLQKPFAPSALARKLREVLDQPGIPRAQTV